MSTVPTRIDAAVLDSLNRIAAPGDWWTGEEKLALSALARTAFAERHLAPWLRQSTSESIEKSDLEPEVTRIVTKLAADASQIDGAWAKEATALVGAPAYVEMVSLASTMAVIDAFAEALGRPRADLPDALEGDTARLVPEGVADIGAYVHMTDPWTDANVGRALTLSPSGNTLYRSLALAMYHEGQFYDLDWDRPISRPQAEVVATAVSAANECFY
ncbi:MAG: hypothetical protein ACR2P0_16490 [Acidimicrobiales bacterium]